MRFKTLILLGLICPGQSTQFRAVAGSNTSSYQVVHGWPQLPEGLAFGQVSGVSVDSHNHVFVFHRGDHPIMCFEGMTGKLIAAWGDGLIGVAHGLKVDQENNVWVTDIKNQQVYKFSHDGALLMTVGAKEVAGLDGKHFNQPTDVVVAPNGDFYVADGYGNSRVTKFSANGDFLFDWGRKGDQQGEFDTPHGITMDKQGRVYVADRANARIQVFDERGKFLTQWKSRELGRPWGLTVGPDNLLYVVDGGDMNPKPPDRGRVLKLDLDGRILETWGAFGSYDGQFYWAHAVSVGRNGDVYVCDVDLGRRVQKFVRH
jgi:peptidylamidoglycolate lyase